MPPETKITPLRCPLNAPAAMMSGLRCSPDRMSVQPDAARAVFLVPDQFPFGGARGQCNLLPMATVLIATDLVVRYNEQTVLNGATLAFEEHDRVGLVGRNGCGKTTFLKIIAGLQTPDSGTVTQRRNLVISYLPQEFTLDLDRTVYENVRSRAQHVLDCIAEFEALPAAAKRHAELEERIVALDGWSLDRRIATALAHLNCPAAARRVD